MIVSTSRYENRGFRSKGCQTVFLPNSWSDWVRRPFWTPFWFRKWGSSLWWSTSTLFANLNSRWPLRVWTHSSTANTSSSKWVLTEQHNLRWPLLLTFFVVFFEFHLHFVFVLQSFQQSFVIVRRGMRKSRSSPLAKPSPTARAGKQTNVKSWIQANFWRFPL